MYAFMYLAELKVHEFSTKKMITNMPNNYWPYYHKTVLKLEKGPKMAQKTKKYFFNTLEYALCFNTLQYALCFNI